MGITSPQGLEMMPEHKQKAFKENYGKFYGVDEGESVKIDYNKLYQASREAPKVMPNMPDNSKFKRDMKVFFAGEASETQSNLGHATQKFFADTCNSAKGNPLARLGEKFQRVQDSV